MQKFKSTKIGIIGCGYWATNIIKTLESIKVKNIFIFDTSLTKLNLMKKKFPYVTIVKNIKQIIKINLDCYFLVTPASKHYKIALKILKNKNDLFIEKPVTLSTKHLKHLISITKKNKNIMMSGYVYNYNVYINYIKKILKRKILGSIKYMYFERCNLGPIRNDASCIWDLASHDISTSLYLLNKKPTVIKSQKYDFLKKTKFDISSLNLDFAKIKVEIKSSWLYPEKTRKVVIIGDKKMLQFDELSPGNKIKIYNKYATYYPNIVRKFPKKFFSPNAKIKIGKTFEPKIKFFPPLKKEIIHFLECIKKRKTPITDGNYALNISKIIEGIEKQNPSGN